MIKTIWSVAKYVPIVVAVQDCFYSPAYVNGTSMQPTFNPDDTSSMDVVLAEKWSIKLYKYRRGDVVTLRSPEKPNMLLTKRLLALEGDWIAVPGKMEVEKIPKGHCWVEGDNLDFSMDSRTKYGPVPLALIEARVTHILWPPSRIQQVQSSMPLGRLLVKNEDALKESSHFGAF